MDELDFGWGNPYFLLETLTNKYTPVVQSGKLSNYCSYGPDYGDETLIKNTRSFIKITTGKDYKHVFITHGATGAITTLLRAYKALNNDYVMTPSKYGYPFYDKMIKDAEMNRLSFNQTQTIPINAITLVDSPSNPEGKIHDQTFLLRQNDIWDSVYHNPIYIQDWNRDKNRIPKHDVMVGSYSKVLGLTGARVGFIATNIEPFYKELADRHLYELATISIFSQAAINNLLSKVNIEKFMEDGHRSLNENRSQFQSIEKYFDGQPVQENGMFYFAKADKHTKALLEKCNVKYVDFDDDYVRMNIGQRNEIVRELVKRIKQEDRI